MKQNILIFCHSYVGGFIEANNQYTKIFDKAHYVVYVVYLRGSPSAEIAAKHLTEHVYFLNSPAASTRGLKWDALKKMFQLQRQKSFKIVICHRYKPSYILLLLAKVYQFQAIFFVMSEMRTFSQWHRKLLFGALAKHNMALAGVSNAVRDDLRKDAIGIPKERIITLYNMIDIDLLEPKLVSKTSARQALNLKPQDFCFGILARLAEAKDHGTLIHAFKIAKPVCPTAKLIIMGEGVLKEKLQAQIDAAGLQHCVFLTGYLPDAFTLLKALDVFVLSSIKEAFGRVLLEAMVAKVPIIATKVNGIPEVIGEAGELVATQDPHALADKMIQLYQLPPHTLTARGNAGYQRAVNEFSIPRFKEIFFNLPLIRQNHSL